MVRSLWTGATGMIAQQTNLDVIANNLANVNTTGYKTETNEFKSLLYQTIQTETTSANGETKPTSAQVGLGVRNASINTVFTQGSLLASENDTDFAIDGKGFFAVKADDGNTYYTRNGTFQWSEAGNGSHMLCDTQGNPLIDSTGKTIVLSNQYVMSKVTVGRDGSILYPDASNNAQPIGMTIGLFQFNNPGGLKREGDNLFSQTAASGQPLNEATTANLDKSRVIQGYLEGSNVNVADEMVNMITTQRAYEFNSKVITTSDTMLEQANNLRR